MMKTFGGSYLPRRYQRHSLLSDLDGEGHSFSNYFARFLYNARIWTVMVKSRPDLGYSRLWLDEDLSCVLLAKMISTS
jgi:hypothetical protein